MQMSIIIPVFLTLVALCEGVELDNDVDVCANGGKPLEGVYRKCSCAYGYKGYDCSQRIGPCDGDPCRNSARCIEKNDGTFSCKCTEGYVGILCEKEFKTCDSNPCQNGGNCTNWFKKAFKCKCPQGFKGFDCSTKILPCEVSPCKNNGMCSNQNDSFKCICTNGHVGPLCGRKDALYSSLILEGKAEYLEQLKTWLNDETDWHLCYRASKHGWRTGDFHSRCDYKGPTVTIVRVGYYIFGGYSDIAWGGSTGYRTTTNSFLFSLRNKDNLAPFKAPVYQNSQKAIYNNAGYGPTFGGGHDLYIKDNAHLSTGSYSNFGYTYKPPSGYKYNTAEVKALLAGNYNFIPTEVELFYLG